MLKNKLLFTGFIVLFITLFSFTFSINKASAAVGDLTVTGADEITNTLTGFTATAVCPGGTPASATDTAGTATFLAATLQAAAPAGAGCADTNVVTITFAKDGYVKSNSTLTYAIAGVNTKAFASIKYGLKVTVIGSSNSIAISGATVKAGDALGTTCVESGSTGIYYCAIPLANTSTTAQVVKTGFDTVSSTYTDRTIATDPQSTLNISMNVASSNVSSTPPASSNVPLSIIPGCGNRSKGYSVASGESCANNRLSVDSSVVTTDSSVITTDSSTKSEVKSPYNFGTKILKNGSKGDAVKELQKFLNKRIGLGLKIDGILGPKTINFIKKWQKDNGLKDDGLIGPKTKAKMNSES